METIHDKTTLIQRIYHYLLINKWPTVAQGVAYRLLLVLWANGSKDFCTVDHWQTTHVYVNESTSGCGSRECNFLFLNS